MCIHIHFGATSEVITSSAEPARRAARQPGLPFKPRRWGRGRGLVLRRPPGPLGGRAEALWPGIAGWRNEDLPASPAGSPSRSSSGQGPPYPLPAARELRDSLGCRAVIPGCCGAHGRVPGAEGRDGSSGGRQQRVAGPSARVPLGPGALGCPAAEPATAVPGHWPKPAPGGPQPWQRTWGHRIPPSAGAAAVGTPLCQAGEDGTPHVHYGVWPRRWDALAASPQHREGLLLHRRLLPCRRQESPSRMVFPMPALPPEPAAPPGHLPSRGAQGNHVYLQIGMLWSQMREIIRGSWNCQRGLLN